MSQIVNFCGHFDGGSFLFIRGSEQFRSGGTPCTTFLTLTANLYIKPLTEIQEGDLYFCLEERTVCVSSQEIELTAKEFDALHLLIVNRKRVLTFETIAYHVWGEEYIDVTPKTIHNLLSRLRQKLQIAPEEPEYVISVRGVGYKFDIPHTEK